MLLVNGGFRELRSCWFHSTVNSAPFISAYQGAETRIFRREVYRALIHNLRALRNVVKAPCLYSHSLLHYLLWNGVRGLRAPIN